MGWLDAWRAEENSQLLLPGPTDLDLSTARVSSRFGCILNVDGARMGPGRRLFSRSALKTSAPLRDTPSKRAPSPSQ